MSSEFLKIYQSINFSVVPSKYIVEYEAIGFFHMMMKLLDES